MNDKTLSSLLALANRRFKTVLCATLVAFMLLSYVLLAWGIHTKKIFRHHVDQGIPHRQERMLKVSIIFLHSINIMYVRRWWLQGTYRHIFNACTNRNIKFWA